MKEEIFFVEARCMAFSSLREVLNLLFIDFTNYVINVLIANMMKRGYFHPQNKDAKNFEYHLNPVMLVSIG